MQAVALSTVDAAATPCSKRQPGPMGAAKGAKWALVPPSKYLAGGFLEDAIQGADHFGAVKAPPFQHSRRPRRKLAALQYTVRH